MVDQATVDVAVNRLLRTKFELGLFEQPYVDVGSIDIDTDCDRRLAREVADKSMVLLKNDGILPLRRNLHRVAVIGPNADEQMALFVVPRSIPKSIVVLVTFLPDFLSASRSPLQLAG